MRHPLFHSATLRLTAWYTLILLFISIVFSLILLQLSTHELGRSYRLPRPGEMQQGRLDDDFRAWREERLSESRQRLVGQLVLFNLAVLTSGALGSYILARRTLQPVEDALEAQTRFSSDAAHELRTPLTIMQSEIEVSLRSKNATKQSREALLRSSLDEVQHMRTLTDRLLLLADNNDMPLAPNLLEPIAIEAVNRVIPLAQAKKISVDNSVGAITVIGNAESLTDTLIILLENAIKYSPPKSKIILSASAKTKHAEICVSDNGSGIAPKDLPYIFDRFYRADTSRSSQNVAGHGLGLSIAKQIINAHNGHISAHSNPRAKGTSFTISIPLA
ncbi:HAMP domain-containing histidine kinase [Candidatus Saccharibacteria bacterium]|nr:MAG: HAMP domain-containing histidine kinase [Candidatus Saccharibacteria bacterium]